MRTTTMALIVLCTASALQAETIVLRSGQVEEESRDDELLQLANLIWEWVVECSITAMDIDPSTIPPQTPIGKDRKLLARYYEARKQQSLEDQS